MVDFLLVLIELFLLAITVEQYVPILVEIAIFERGWVTLNANLRGKGRPPPTNFGIRKLESLSYRMVKKLPKISTG